MDNGTLYQSYEKFSRLLLDEEIYRNPATTFAGICTIIGADPEALGDLVMKEMGMNGDEIIEAYRRQEHISAF